MVFATLRRGLESRSGSNGCHLDVGPGYRVYFKRRGTAFIILLAGGDKSTQARDIKTALELARNLEE